MNLPPLLRWALLPLSLAYGEVVRIRVWMYARGILKQKRLGKPVISVGNLTVGGTGKTPMVIWLAERFLAEGKHVGILSRGYKGSGDTSDEIELMRARLQQRARFGVGADRYAQGRRMEENGEVDVFLLDDGFQHLRLYRDANILLMDASKPLGNERLLPAGRLREPLSEMGRADFLVFTRTETSPATLAAVEKFNEFPVFASATRLIGFRKHGHGLQLVSANEIGGGPFYAFCGIGNPGSFFLDLKNWGVALAGESVFADHHRYDQRDASEIEAVATRAGARALVTTEKDEQNFSGVKFEAMPVYIAVIELMMPRENEFLHALVEKLATRTAAA
jgi:tetraacyldisaccharide 4'-kinase